MMARFTKATIQLATVGALLGAFASAASAQKAKPAGPPVTTKGATQASPNAAKGQAMAEAKRTEARENKAVRAANKTEDRAEHAAVKRAHTEPKALLKGVKLSKTERKTVKDIEQKYAAQLKDLEKQEDAAEKAGTPDASIVGKIDALRTQERAELRAALPAAQTARFDRNATAIDKKP